MTIKAMQQQQQQFRGMAGVKGRATYTTHGEPVTDISQEAVSGGSAGYPQKIGETRPLHEVGDHRYAPAEEQLPMFQSAHEVMGRLAGSVDTGTPDSAGWESNWGRKLDEAKYDTWRGTDGKTLVDAIGKGGYSSHIHLHNTGGGWIHGQGHHRLAAGLELEKQTGQPVHVPVEHHPTSFWDTPNKYSRDFPQNSDRSS